jgi:hypothetical protein
VHCSYAGLWAGASANGRTVVRPARCSVAQNWRRRSLILLNYSIQTTAGGYCQKKKETCLPGLHKIFKIANTKTIRPLDEFQEARGCDTGRGRGGVRVGN